MPLVGGAFGSARQVHTINFDGNRTFSTLHVCSGDRRLPLEVIVGLKLCNDIAAGGYADGGRSIEVSQR